MYPVTTLADVIMSAVGHRLHYSRSPLIGWYLSGPDERILIDPLIGRTCRYHFGAGVMPDFDTSDFRAAVVSELRSRAGVDVKRPDIPAETYETLSRSHYSNPTVLPGELLPGYGDWFGSPADLEAQERAADLR
ncbi:hypothetical protein ACFUNF_23055 [Streptomyces sp. NPDC057291]|uniref:hypothetical protein n=1 Tax=Streptomyces sp. NPDC057291 TaxID=3346087 RepID=UPI00362BC9C7